MDFYFFLKCLSLAEMGLPTDWLTPWLAAPLDSNSILSCLPPAPLHLAYGGHPATACWRKAHPFPEPLAWTPGVGRAERTSCRELALCRLQACASLTGALRSPKVALPAVLHPPLSPFYICLKIKALGNKIKTQASGLPAAPLPETLAAHAGGTRELWSEPSHITSHEVASRHHPSLSGVPSHPAAGW